MARKESAEFSLWGDLDGATVGDLRRMLDEDPADARIDVRSEKVYQFGRGGDQDREFFVITWDE